MKRAVRYFDKCEELDLWDIVDSCGVSSDDVDMSLDCDGVCAEITFDLDEDEDYIWIDETTGYRIITIRLWFKADVNDLFDNSFEDLIQYSQGYVSVYFGKVVESEPFDEEEYLEEDEEEEEEDDE